jgi:formylglycine-generating enzyme required for sulfatase activity
VGSLAELSKLVGFFSHSREDDEDFRGELSAIRTAIGRNLAALLGRKKRQDFDLWQDMEAIAPGKKWKTEIAKAIEESVFFIPIVTPRAVQSPDCRDEFEAFLAREKALGRNDLVFPILYIPVPALRDEAKRRSDPVLAIVAERQFEDWSSFGYEDINSPACRQKIRLFCEDIAETLHEDWISPEERLQLEAEAKKRAEEAERAGPRRKELAKKRGEDEERVRVPAPARAKAAFVRFRTPAKLVPGRSYRDVSISPEMILVPAGRFLMGSHAGQGDDREHPQHEVTIAKRFMVAKFALTFDEWDACAADGGCRRDVGDEGWGRARRPVINVSWDDAQAYVRWLSRITRNIYRLLSEAEWEYAARAGSETKYPWGDEIKLNGRAMANCDGCGSQWGNKQTVPVGSFPANAFGLCDMVGNVWEWTEDCWNESYQGAPADGSPWTNTDSRCVVRGGSWDADPGSLRSAFRYGSHTSDRGKHLGFRVAQTLSP